MGIIKPELISILSIKVYKAIQTTSDDYLNNPVKPAGIELKIGQHTALNLEKKNIRIRLNVQLEATDDEKKPIGLSGEYGIEFQVHADNLDEFVVRKDEKNLIDRKLGGVLNGIIFSTARGIIYERTSSTLFNGVLLPVIDPNLLMDKKSTTT